MAFKAGTAKYSYYLEKFQQSGSIGGGGLTVGTGRVYLVPFEVEHDSTIDRIIVFWMGTAAGNVTAGIYHGVGTVPVGNGVVVQSASVAKSGTSRWQEITVSQTFLKRGLYWVALESDENTSVCHRQDGTSSVGLTLQACYYDQGYGVLADPCPAVTVAGSLDFICRLRCVV